ncbi:MAG: pilus assembly FimT family protein [Thermoguttaceae bacterium]
MHRGLTLFELLAVMGILLVLGTLVVPVVSDRIGQSRDDVTRQSLLRLREAIAGTYHDDMDGLPRPGEAALSAGRANHPQLAYLFLNPETHLDGDPLTRDYDVAFDPVSRRGWRGPYLLGSGFTYAIDAERGFSTLYGEDGDPAVQDGWGNPIVLQEPFDPAATEYDRSRHVRLVSAGPDGVLDTPADVLLPTAAERGDDLVLFLWIAEP